jgi:hypothetical protein
MPLVDELASHIKPPHQDRRGRRPSWSPGYSRFVESIMASR